MNQVNNLIPEQMDVDMLPPEPPQELLLPALEDPPVVPEPQEPEIPPAQPIDEERHVDPLNVS